MFNSALIETFKTFNKQELKDFSLFIQSPFFNTNQSVVKLFEQIRILYPEFDEINLEKLALKLGVTRHQLSQVLNEHAGLNFFEYINQRRIEEAKTLLLTTSKKELNIIEIAYKVGYSNKVTFNNTFKKHTGMTPSEFRMAPPTEEKGNILPIRKGQI